MNQKDFRTSLLLVPLLMSGFCLVCDDAAAQESCVSAQCHATLLKHATVHPVAESCEGCHASVATPHPQKGKKTFKLNQEPPDLCYTCHEQFGKKSVVHFPVQGGMCTTCHNPHSSDQPKLLAQPLKDLCGTCHADHLDFKVVHSPVSAGNCTACHSPHESDNKALLLLASVKDTCSVCHDGVIPKNATVLHGTDNDGNCTRCHNPHGAPYAHLLVGEFPPETYVPYTDTEFALCFSCHKRDMVEYPDASSATNFRDGERNLHFLHINNKKKGRSCMLCHNIHGGTNQKLIADSVPFGKWSLPLKFVKTETGGGCSPGCHRPQYYDRKTPGKKPPAPKPNANSD